MVWLTENTQKNQEKVFELNPNLPDSTTFQTADYSLAYLTKLMEKISEKMGDGTLSFVTSAALYEQTNRVCVTMTTDDADSVAQVRALDTIGGAIEIQYSSAQVKDEVLQIE